MGFSEWNTLPENDFFPDLIEVRAHGELFIRVGEANNPDPDLTSLCANINSLRTRWPSIQDQWQADVYLWQEVRLGFDGQNIMAAQLREHGLHAQWSAPQPTAPPKAAPGRCRPQVTPWSVKQGGRAIVARQEFPLYTDNARDALRHELWETRRWAAAALPCGDRKQHIHVRSAYAEAGASTDDRLLAQSELFLQKMFAEIASLGEQPVVLSLDANLSRERSATLNALFNSGRWIDVACEVAVDRDQLQATYHKDGVLPGSAQSGAARIDFLVCNRCAWAHFKSFRFRFDLKIPCHVVTLSPPCAQCGCHPSNTTPIWRDLRNLKQMVVILWKPLLSTCES